MWTAISKVARFFDVPTLFVVTLMTSVFLIGHAKFWAILLLVISIGLFLTMVRRRAYTIRDSIFIAFMAALTVWNVWDRGQPWRVGIAIAFFAVLLFVSRFRRRTR
jgi:hypothetical protein